MDIAELINEQVRLNAQARNEAIEMACERVVTGGICGVSVYEDVAMVDPDVPYGEIHYHQCRRDQRRY